MFQFWTRAAAKTGISSDGMPTFALSSVQTTMNPSSQGVRVRYFFIGDAGLIAVGDLNVSGSKTLKEVRNLIAASLMRPPHRLALFLHEEGFMLGGRLLAASGQQHRMAQKLSEQTSTEVVSFTVCCLARAWASDEELLKLLDDGRLPEVPSIVVTGKADETCTTCLLPLFAREPRPTQRYPSGVSQRPNLRIKDFGEGKQHYKPGQGLVEYAVGLGHLVHQECCAPASEGEKDPFDWLMDEREACRREEHLAALNEGWRAPRFILREIGEHSHRRLSCDESSHSPWSFAADLGRRL